MTLAVVGLDRHSEREATARRVNLAPACCAVYVCALGNDRCLYVCPCLCIKHNHFQYSKGFFFVCFVNIRPRLFVCRNFSGVEGGNKVFLTRWNTSDLQWVGKKR